MQDQLTARVHDAAGDVQTGPGEWLQRARKQMPCFVSPGADYGGRSCPTAPGMIGHRQQDTRQRDAVGDAVVDSQQQRATGSVAVDEVGVPQRLVAIQRRRREIADELL